MGFEHKLQLSGLFTVILLVCFYNGFIAVNGQFGYETPNYLCGGHFRWFSGSINFTHTNLTDPEIDNGTSKVCIWQIIPSPTYPKLNITLDFLQLDPNDKLAITGFPENSDQVSSTALTAPGNFIFEGDVVVVTLITTVGVRNTGRFNLTWNRMDDVPMRNTTRFVVISNTYGEQTSRPPYYAAGFLGNSISTFAFPQGNSTDRYTLMLDTWQLELNGGSEGCPGLPSNDIACNLFLVCKINPDARMEIEQSYNGNITVQDVQFSNKHGLFLIMWGGNRFNASGGGRWTYEFTHLRD